MIAMNINENVIKQSLSDLDKGEVKNMKVVREAGRDNSHLYCQHLEG